MKRSSVLMEKLPVTLRLVLAPSSAMEVSAMDTSPLLSRVPVMVSVFPVSNSSEAFARRNAVESRVSRVSALEVPALIQFPLIAKHPVVTLIPFAKVEEAVVEVTLKRLVWIPPAKVEVAVVVPV